MNLSDIVRMYEAENCVPLGKTGVKAHENESMLEPKVNAMTPALD